MATSASDFGRRAEEIAQCPICLGDFKKPKLLPCIHKFCLQCLEGHCKDKLAEDEVSCPLCRKEFTIPTEGPSGLPDLVEAKQQTTDAPNIVSEDCSSEYCDDRGDKVFGTDCSQKMRGGPHQIQLLESEVKTEVKQVRGGSYCDRHTDEKAELYCSDCNIVACKMCCVTEHKQHKRQELIKVADNIAKQISADAELVRGRANAISLKEKGLDREKNRLIDELKNTKAAILQKGKDAKQVIDKQVRDLNRQLHEMNRHSMKEIETRNDELSLALTKMESFSAYCSELTAKGRCVDITRAANDLQSRAEELKTYTVPDDLCTEPIVFIPVDIQELVDKQQAFVGLLERKQISGTTEIESEVTSEESYEIPGEPPVTTEKSDGPDGSKITVVTTTVSTREKKRVTVQTTTTYPNSSKKIVVRTTTTQPKKTQQKNPVTGQIDTVETDEVVSDETCELVGDPEVTTETPNELDGCRTTVTTMTTVDRDGTKIVTVQRTTSRSDGTKGTIVHIRKIIREPTKKGKDAPTDTNPAEEPEVMPKESDDITGEPMVTTEKSDGPDGSKIAVVTTTTTGKDRTTAKPEETKKVQTQTNTIPPGKDATTTPKIDELNDAKQNLEPGNSGLRTQHPISPSWIMDRSNVWIRHVQEEDYSWWYISNHCLLAIVALLVMVFAYLLHKSFVSACPACPARPVRKWWFT